ncbi:DNA-binding XRE family transcriptional regulator [Pseudaminobacter salicylatoxidans]|uniref:DNA-binding XRE family transcriptional regulator n=1 Tax=Pseudaminobacter salicylatoxidans TaxID=93369 RepID=A0A316C1L4_PSESE|nr:helix-turn-helix transcriptional regulator [Pseudaminobacter salicylatoxidans]PWJ80601.1 DNA-binding XRE family transcriptional regulator [Pseudaminobacter salicylatoxidans]
MDRLLSRCKDVNMAPVKKDLRPLGNHFLKEWREHFKLDQEELAERINLSRTTISKIETKDSPYSQRILEAIAEVYRCSPAQLLMQNPSRPDSLVQLFEQAEKLEGDRRAHVMSIIEAALRIPSG